MGATGGSSSVAVTGLGLITPIGNDRPTVVGNLRGGRHGFEPFTFWDNPDLALKLAGTVREFNVASTSWRDWSWPARYSIPRETIRGLAPHGVYSVCAVAQAIEDSGLTERSLRGDPDTGLFCASAGSAMLLHHNLAQMRLARGQRGNPLGLVSSIAGTLNFNLAAHFGVTGAICGFVSACSSSSHAIGYALDEIRLGRLDRVIVVGSEEVNGDTILPFLAMRAVSTASDPRLASRPFDAGRDGFIGSGGAVAMILENPAVAAARGARIMAEFIGWGQAADGYSVASSHPEGAGLRLAMERALAGAGVSPGEVDYVNAHATSTPVGDRAEALALRSVFTAAGFRPIVSSTKGLTGHPLSMSGVMEAAFCVLAIDDGFVPGNAHLVEPDPSCEGLNLPRETGEGGPRIVLSNSSGFGGSNVCHVLRRAAGA
jgi:3-oxoacyl-(acyl-carrier-protein) synthase